MPDTPLMGPGGQPAIDQETGMPLTMEMMLRRRGIVQMGNQVGMMGPGDVTATSPVPTTAPPTGTPVATNPAATPTTALGAMAASLAGNSATAVPNPSVAGVAPGVVAASAPTAGGTPIDATGGSGGDMGSMLAALGVLAGTGAGGYALYKARGRKPNATIITGGSAGSTAKRIQSGKPPLGLPSPVKKLTGPQDTTSAAKALAKRGNTVSKNTPLLEDQRYVGEGVATTVGRKLPKAVKEAPAAGLARTLSRVVRGL